MTTTAKLPYNLQKIAIIAKRNIIVKKDVVLGLIEYLKKKNKKILYDNNLAELLDGSVEGNKKEWLLKNADMAIILGGDGTLLKTARRIGKKKVPVLGVNLGTKGFLTECTEDKMYYSLDKIFQGHYVIDRRFLLRVTVYRDNEKTFTSLALNDAVINQGLFARLIDLRLEVNQRKITEFEADGIIVATPTGSTAHALSAGGPIIHPSVDSFVIVPICPASLSIRPIIIPNDRQLKVVVQTHRVKEHVGLTIDGQETFDLSYGDEIKFRKSSRYFDMLRITGGNYYKVLRQKLHWGKD
ncbi:NAD(+)/NADH kinase [Candidatus Peregrinibacteria bacterium]|nr:NAD(+)/NADH kinase [Candidatus Peregrinibacteria bacterium]